MGAITAGEVTENAAAEAKGVLGTPLQVSLRKPMNKQPILKYQTQQYLPYTKGIVCLRAVRSLEATFVTEVAKIVFCTIP